MVALMTSPLDDVIPLLAQVHLLGRGTGPLRFKSDMLASGNVLSAAYGRLFGSAAFAFFHFTQ